MTETQAEEATRIMGGVVWKLADNGCSDEEIAKFAPALWKQVLAYVSTGRWDATWH